VEYRKSKVEIREVVDTVIPAKTGIHNLVVPRFRGGDTARSVFRSANFEFPFWLLTTDSCLLFSSFQFPVSSYRVYRTGRGPSSRACRSQIIPSREYWAISKSCVSSSASTGQASSHKPQNMQRERS